MTHANLGSVGVTDLVSLEYQPWRVVYTYPQQEKKIFNKLLALGMNAYLPLRKIVKQWSDRKKQLEVPLFPNYLFVKVPDIYRFRVLAIPGVTRFISFDGRLAAVSDKEMKMI
jgi:transcription antitermination factor NusG